MQSNMSKQAQLSELSIATITKAKILAGKVKDKSLQTAKDRKVQVTVASAAGGTVAIGVCGAVLGGVVGIPFALFTFGLSIPFSATVGAVVGGTAGCATGGTVGFTVFTWRNEIEKFLGGAWSRVKVTTTTTKAQMVVKSRETYKAITTRLSAGKTFAMSKAHAGSVATKQKASELVNSSVQLAKQPQAQVTVASATVSGVALGASGGAVGLAAGGIVGAAVGVLPAIFTFGLSIPIGAVIGGGTGLCLGTVTGGATGVVGGGAVGYGVYGKKTDIRDGVSKCVSYVTEKKEQVFGSAKCIANTTSKSVAPSKKVRTGSA